MSSCSSQLAKGPHFFIFRLKNRTPTSKIAFLRVLWLGCKTMNDFVYKSCLEWGDMIYASTNGRDYVTDADGRLTGADAVKFFSLSQLPRGELKQVYCIWTLCDSLRRVPGSFYFLYSGLSLFGSKKLLELQVWAVADVKRQGFLGFKEFVTAMQASFASAWYWLCWGALAKICLD